MDKPCSTAPIIAAILLLLPVLYVGSYLALVDPMVSSTAPLMTVLTRKGSSDYRAFGNIAPIAFWPLEQIHRKLRPNVWASSIGFPSPRHEDD
jgi:hypothetical protein